MTSVKLQSQNSEVLRRLIPEEKWGTTRSRASETRARVKITPREKWRHAVGREKSVETRSLCFHSAWHQNRDSETLEKKVYPPDFQQSTAKPRGASRQRTPGTKVLALDQAPHWRGKEEEGKKKAWAGKKGKAADSWVRYFSFHPFLAYEWRSHARSCRNGPQIHSITPSLYSLRQLIEALKFD